MMGSLLDISHGEYYTICKKLIDNGMKVSSYPNTLHASISFYIEAKVRPWDFKKRRLIKEFAASIESRCNDRVSCIYHIGPKGRHRLTHYVEVNYIPGEGSPKIKFRAF